MTALTFAPATHTYDLDGVRVPSVTGILKASSLIDFSRVPPSELDRARVRGTVVHQAIHYFNERDLDVDRFCAEFPDYAGYLRAWIAFTEERRFVPRFNEYRVASRRHQVAGTIDCLGVLDGHGALLDFATGRPEDVAKDLQTAAYHGLAREWADGGHDPALDAFFAGHGLVVRRAAIALKRDGRFSVHAYADPSDWRTFTTLVEAQRIITTRRGEEWSEVAA
jgi:hypothetical protein